MNKNISVSVILPAYNSSSFIGETIDSVLNQTFKNFELIVVDDGSTDKTKEIIEEFIKKDERVKYFYQKNSGGPSKPKNFGISKAKGKYIAFLDHDDIWISDKLEKQLSSFKENKSNNLGIVSCYVKTFEDEDILIKRKDSCGDKALLLNDKVFPFSCSSIFTKKSLLEKWGGLIKKWKGLMIMIYILG